VDHLPRFGLQIEQGSTQVKENRRHCSWYQIFALILGLGSANLFFANATLSHARELDLADLVKTQKENYRTHQWSALFGTAQAYRMNWWNEHPSLTLISLEALGLIKLCRYQEAETLLASAPVPAAATITERRRRESILSFLGARRSVGMRSKSPTQAKSISNRKPEFFWPLKEVTQLVQELPPSSFRVKVESLCQN